MSSVFSRKCSFRFLKILCISCLVWMPCAENQSARQADSGPGSVNPESENNRQMNLFLQSVSVWYIYQFFLLFSVQADSENKQSPPNYQSTFSHCSRTAGAVFKIVCVVGSSLCIVVSGMWRDCFIVAIGRGWSQTCLLQAGWDSAQTGQQCRFLHTNKLAV